MLPTRTKKHKISEVNFSSFPIQRDVTQFFILFVYLYLSSFSLVRQIVFDLGQNNFSYSLEAIFKKEYQNDWSFEKTFS